MDQKDKKDFSKGFKCGTLIFGGIAFVMLILFWISL